jgi:hypothetical protein
MSRQSSAIGVLGLVVVACGRPAPTPATPQPVRAAAATPPPVAKAAPPLVAKAAPPPVAKVAPAPEAAPPAPFDVAGELAWARKRWPRELGKVDVDAPVDALRRWLAPDAAMPVWVTTPAYRCKRGELRRGAADDESLSLTVFTQETATLREFETASVGSELMLGAAGGSERRGPGGLWQAGDAWGRSEQASWGHLSQVTADVAQFAGVWGDIAASCAGAATKLPCANGGVVTCSACTDVAIAVTPRPMGMIQNRTVRPLSIGCPRCPTQTNPELERVTALLANVDPWRIELPRSSAIYRTLAGCKARRSATNR